MILQLQWIRIWICKPCVRNFIVRIRSRRGTCGSSAPQKGLPRPLCPGRKAESMEWPIEGQAFSRSYDSARPPTPFRLLSQQATYSTRRLRKRDNLLTVERGRGRARSRIIRPKESLVLYKSFNTPWVEDTFDFRLEVFKGWPFPTLS